MHIIPARPLARAGCAIVLAAAASVVQADDSVAVQRDSSDPAIEITNVHVVTLDKVLEPDSPKYCKDWSLSFADVEYFFAHAYVLTSEEHHHVYYVLGCGYSGLVQIGNEQYSFGLNAGSFVIVRDGVVPGRTWLYGCKKACARLFPFGLFDDEGVDSPRTED